MDLVATAAVAFVAAGFIKGVLGFGFPVVALIFLTLAIGLFDALAIIVVPTIVTNIWQALSGPYLRDIFSRMWLYFAVAMGGILLSSLFLAEVDVNWLTGLLGLVLITFAVSRLLDVEIRVPREREPVLSVGLGLVNGMLTGFTGSFMVPSVLYMQALGVQQGYARAGDGCLLRAVDDYPDDLAGQQRPDFGRGRDDVDACPGAFLSRHLRGPMDAGSGSMRRSSRRYSLPVY